MLKRTWSTVASPARAAIDMAKREDQLLYDKSVSKINDLYHHPDGFYALDDKHKSLEVERVHKEGRNNLEGKLYLIASGAHYRCLMRDEDENCVIKDSPLGCFCGYQQLEQPDILSHQVKPSFEHPTCFRCSVPSSRSIHRNPI